MTDARLVFSEGQAITANAANVISTVLDQGALVDDRGVALAQFGPHSGQINLIVSIRNAPTAGVGILCELHDSADGATFHATGIGVHTAIPNAILVAGYTMLHVPLMPGLRRYLRMVYTTTGNHAGSAGTINARLELGSMSENVAPFRA